MCSNNSLQYGSVLYLLLQLKTYTSIKAVWCTMILVMSYCVCIQPRVKIYKHIGAWPTVHILYFSLLQHKGDSWRIYQSMMPHEDTCTPTPSTATVYYSGDREHEPCIYEYKFVTGLVIERHACMAVSECRAVYGSEKRVWCWCALQIMQEASC